MRSSRHDQIFYSTWPRDAHRKIAYNAPRDNHMINYLVLEVMDSSDISPDLDSDDACVDQMNTST